MMWLVNAALRRPYTVWVGMLLTLVVGVVTYYKNATDILPNLKIPVVVVFASYRGMPAPDMERTVTSVLERALTKCDHLEHVESRSLLGIGIVRVYFRSEVDADLAASQVISIVASEMQNMPPGMLMPTVMKYDASAIPVGNLVLSSETRDDKFLLDLADYRLREELAGIEGLASAPVFGGVFRQVQIYVHPRTLESLKLSPMDVARIVNNQSQVIPTGEIRIGNQNYYVSSNSMVQNPKDFEKIPLWADGRKVVYLGDVANVVDGTRWRTNTVRVDGNRAVYMPLLRQAGASAVKVVDNVKDFLPKLRERGVIPEDVEVEVAFDQSQYVRDALSNLQYEGLAGAILASLTVLLFLGSLRSTWIVALSIPLSILAAFMGLYFTGNTLNIMTLGGLALVLGRVVDDSIVDVENTVRHLNMGKSPFQAVRDSAAEIAVPVLMATVTTVVVFMPLAFMTGVNKYLFTPLAVSASLAMFGSYIVSRTVSPLCNALFQKPHHAGENFPWTFFSVFSLVATAGVAAWTFLGWKGLGGLSLVLLILVPIVYLLFRVAPRFEKFYERVEQAYEASLRKCLNYRLLVLGLVAALMIPTYLAFTGIGQELFPEVDSSEFTVHLRAAGGPRVEETERQVAAIENIIREVVPAEDRKLLLSNVGLSSRWSAIYTPNNGPHAAFVRVQLRSGFDGRHTTSSEYVDRLRKRLNEEFPANDFFFESGGMIRQILNAGAVAPIEVQVTGRNAEERRRAARYLANRINALPDVRDVYLPQGMDLPLLKVDVDRTRAALLGYTETDVVRNVIIALMSSAQLAPNFWIDPKTGNPYVIGVQYPEHMVEDVHTLENIPISADRGGRGRGTTRLLKDVANIERGQGQVEGYHYNATPVSQLFAGIAGQNLAGAAAQVEKITQTPTVEFALTNLPDDKKDLLDDANFAAALKAYYADQRSDVRAQITDKFGVDPEKLKTPAGVRTEVRGEVTNMRSSFGEMGFTLILAVLLVYLVMAAQFSSWLDPLIMIVAAPLGLIGVVAMLWVTGSSLNIQSMMGVLMMVGISVSNSVLLVEFANRQRADGMETLAAIVSAARIRMKPIVMTTLAAIGGLLPMAIHRHPGDEMNLPLARAVIGGLLGSTILTLFVVPILYVLLKPKGPGAPAVSEDAGLEAM